MRGVNVNKLNKRVEIQENMGVIDDGYGNEIENWQTVATTYAGIRPARGYEVEYAGQSDQEISHNISMRYRTDIKKQRHRIKRGTRIFQIEYIINIEEANVELNLYCLEAVTP